MTGTYVHREQGFRDHGLTQIHTSRSGQAGVRRGFPIIRYTQLKDSFTCGDMAGLAVVMDACQLNQNYE